MWSSYLSLIFTSFSLGTDAFCVSIADGLSFKDISKKKLIFIPLCFALMQGIMPIIGYYLGLSFYNLIKEFDHWIAFGLLLFIGGKMIVDGIIDIHRKEKEEMSNFSYGKILIQGIATSIDALAVGIVLIASEIHILIDALFIGVITFIMCVGGLFLGKQIVKLFKGKIQIATIIGGVVLLLIGVKILLEHLGILVF